MFVKRNKTEGSLDYYFQLKHSIKMILPVICASIIYHLLGIVGQDNYIPQNLIHLVTFIYNSILLPMYLAYFNVLRFSYVKKRIINLIVIVIMPLIGNLIQYIFMYALVMGSLFPQVPYGRDDWSILFFLFPTAVGFIMSISSYIIFEVIVCIIKAIKKKREL